MTSAKFFSIVDPPLSVPNSCNLPFFGQNLANSLLPLSADVICAWSLEAVGHGGQLGLEREDDRGGVRLLVAALQTPAPLRLRDLSIASWVGKIQLNNQYIGCYTQ